MVPDPVILVSVVVARLLLPLLIPKFPLPAILGCLVLDGVDQSIFQAFTSYDLSGYQSYDKALDIYYLTIAYLATMRNWSNQSAFRVSRFLFFYRLVGVVAFEFTQVRALLLIFPNTFEYFFIFYEAVRSRWEPRRMTTRFVVVATAAIWIFVKLPQEYWIHIAQLDTTDLIKEKIFGVNASSSWSDAVANRPWVVVVALIVVAALYFALRWFAHNKLPVADHSLRLAADPLPTEIDTAAEVAAFRAKFGRVFDANLLEKVVLISLVSIVFAQFLPNIEASPLQVTLGVFVLVTANSLLGLWTARHERSISSLALSFVALACLNVALVVIANWLLDLSNGDLQIGATLFFVLLLTLIVTLYDRFRPVSQLRFAGTGLKQ
ncbi:MAG TPA: hypothetical protein VMT88_03875 [Actinomycetes bacterium]|nr:hypothetical protein [Actinomycetes bacterium]